MSIHFSDLPTYRKLESPRSSDGFFLMQATPSFDESSDQCPSILKYRVKIMGHEHSAARSVFF